MFPGFPGRYVFKREPLPCITRLRSRTTSNRTSYVTKEQRRGGLGYWLWIVVGRESVPADLAAIIRGVNRELLAGAPLSECPGTLALRDWLEENEPVVLNDFEYFVSKLGRSRPDQSTKKKETGED